jgi:hypothetical protein
MEAVYSSDTLTAISQRIPEESNTRKQLSRYEAQASGVPQSSSTQVTNYMQLSRSSEAYRRSSGQTTLSLSFIKPSGSLLCLLDPILSQLNPFHILTTINSYSHRVEWDGVSS